MDFRQPDLNLLLVLDAMFEEGSATRVARRLRISQPTVSASLAKLRELYQDLLFVPAPGGMAPTAVALGLRGAVREALDLVEQRVLPAPAFDPATSRRTFHISTSDVGELCFLPQLTEALRLRAPGARLANLLLPPEELHRALEGGAVDVAVGYFPDLNPQLFARQDLFEHPFVVIARAGHPLAGGDLTLDRYLAAQHAVVTAKGRSQELVETMMARLGLERQVVLTTPHFMSLPFLIAQSDLIATVPRAAGTAFGRGLGLIMLPPPIDIPPATLAQHWHRRHDREPGRRWLRRLLAELFAGRDPT